MALVLTYFKLFLRCYGTKYCYGYACTMYSRMYSPDLFCVLYYYVGVMYICNPMEILSVCGDQKRYFWSRMPIWLDCRCELLKIIVNCIVLNSLRYILQLFLSDKACGFHLLYSCRDSVKEHHTAKQGPFYQR